MLLKFQQKSTWPLWSTDHKSSTPGIPNSNHLKNVYVPIMKALAIVMEYIVHTHNIVHIIICAHHYSHIMY